MTYISDKPYLPHWEINPVAVQPGAWLTAPPLYPLARERSSLFSPEELGPRDHAAPPSGSASQA